MRIVSRSPSVDAGRLRGSRRSAESGSASRPGTSSDPASDSSEASSSCSDSSASRSSRSSPSPDRDGRSRLGSPTPLSVGGEARDCGRPRRGEDGSGRRCLQRLSEDPAWPRPQSALTDLHCCRRLPVASGSLCCPLKPPCPSFAQPTTCGVRASRCASAGRAESLCSDCSLLDVYSPRNPCSNARSASAQRIGRKPLFSPSWQLAPTSDPRQASRVLPTHHSIPEALLRRAAAADAAAIQRRRVAARRQSSAAKKKTRQLRSGDTEKPRSLSACSASPGTSFGVKVKSVRSRKVKCSREGASKTTASFSPTAEAARALARALAAAAAPVAKALETAALFDRLGPGSGGEPKTAEGTAKATKRRPKPQSSAAFQRLTRSSASLTKHPNFSAGIDSSRASAIALLARATSTASRSAATTLSQSAEKLFAGTENVSTLRRALAPATPIESRRAASRKASQSPAAATAAAVAAVLAAAAALIEGAEVGGGCGCSERTLQLADEAKTCVARLEELSGASHQASTEPLSSGPREVSAVSTAALTAAQSAAASAEAAPRSLRRQGARSPAGEPGQPLHTAVPQEPHVASAKRLGTPCESFVRAGARRQRTFDTLPPAATGRAARPAERDKERGDEPGGRTQSALCIEEATRTQASFAGRWEAREGEVAGGSDKAVALSRRSSLRAQEAAQAAAEAAKEAAAAVALVRPRQRVRREKGRRSSPRVNHSSYETSSDPEAGGGDSRLPSRCEAGQPQAPPADGGRERERRTCAPTSSSSRTESRCSSREGSHGRQRRGGARSDVSRRRAPSASSRGALGAADGALPPPSTGRPTRREDRHAAQEQGSDSGDTASEGAYGQETEACQNISSTSACVVSLGFAHEDEALGGGDASAASLVPSRNTLLRAASGTQRELAERVPDEQPQHRWQARARRAPAAEQPKAAQEPSATRGAGAPQKEENAHARSQQSTNLPRTASSRADSLKTAPDGEYAPETKPARRPSPLASAADAESGARESLSAAHGEPPAPKREKKKSKKNRQESEPAASTALLADDRGRADERRKERKHAKAAQLEEPRDSVAAAPGETPGASLSPLERCEVSRRASSCGVEALEEPAGEQTPLQRKLSKSRKHADAMERAATGVAQAAKDAREAAAALSEVARQEVEEAAEEAERKRKTAMKREQAARSGEEEAAREVGEQRAGDAHPLSKREGKERRDKRKGTSAKEEVKHAEPGEGQEMRAREQGGNRASEEEPDGQTKTTKSAKKKREPGGEKSTHTEEKDARKKSEKTKAREDAEAAAAAKFFPAANQDGMTADNAGKKDKKKQRREETGDDGGKPGRDRQIAPDVDEADQTGNGLRAPSHALKILPRGLRARVERRAVCLAPQPSASSPPRLQQTRPLAPARCGGERQETESTPPGRERKPPRRPTPLATEAPQREAEAPPPRAATTSSEGHLTAGAGDADYATDSAVHPEAPEEDIGKPQAVAAADAPRDAGPATRRTNLKAQENEQPRASRAALRRPTARATEASEAATTPPVKVDCTRRAAKPGRPASAAEASGRSPRARAALSALAQNATQRTRARARKETGKTQPWRRMLQWEEEWRRQKSWRERQLWTARRAARNRLDAAGPLFLARPWTASGGARNPDRGREKGDRRDAKARALACRRALPAWLVRGEGPPSAGEDTEGGVGCEKEREPAAAAGRKAGETQQQETTTHTDEERKTEATGKPSKSHLPGADPAATPDLNDSDKENTRCEGKCICMRSEGEHLRDRSTTAGGISTRSPWAQNRNDTATPPCRLDSLAAASLACIPRPPAIAASLLQPCEWCAASDGAGSPAEAENRNSFQFSPDSPLRRSPAISSCKTATRCGQARAQSFASSGERNSLLSSGAAACGWLPLDADAASADAETLRRSAGETGESAQSRRQELEGACRQAKCREPRPVEARAAEGRRHQRQDGGKRKGSRQPSLRSSSRSTLQIVKVEARRLRTSRLAKKDLRRAAEKASKLERRLEALLRFAHCLSATPEQFLPPADALSKPGSPPRDGCALPGLVNVNEKDSSCDWLAAASPLPGASAQRSALPCDSMQNEKEEKEGNARGDSAGLTDVREASGEGARQRKAAETTHRPLNESNERQLATHAQRTRWRVRNDEPEEKQTTRDICDSPAGCDGIPRGLTLDLRGINTRRAVAALQASLREIRGATGLLLQAFGVRDEAVGNPTPPARVGIRHAEEGRSDSNADERRRLEDKLGEGEDAGDAGGARKNPLKGSDSETRSLLERDNDVNRTAGGRTDAQAKRDPAKRGSGSLAAAERPRSTARSLAKEAAADVAQLAEVCLAPSSSDGRNANESRSRRLAPPRRWSRLGTGESLSDRPFFSHTSPGELASHDAGASPRRGDDCSVSTLAAAPWDPDKRAPSTGDSRDTDTDARDSNTPSSAVSSASSALILEVLERCILSCERKEARVRQTRLGPELTREVDAARFYAIACQATPKHPLLLLAREAHPSEELPGSSAQSASLERLDANATGCAEWRRELQGYGGRQVAGGTDERGERDALGSSGAHGCGGAARMVSEVTKLRRTRRESVPSADGQIAHARRVRLPGQSAEDAPAGGETGRSKGPKGLEALKAFDLSPPPAIVLENALSADDVKELLAFRMQRTARLLKREPLLRAKLSEQRRCRSIARRDRAGGREGNSGARASAWIPEADATAAAEEGLAHEENELFRTCGSWTVREEIAETLLQEIAEEALEGAEDIVAQMLKKRAEQAELLAHALGRVRPRRPSPEA
ncbi:hypothetical protein BESB_002740 [Besnoitia besnoiti]|uniref:Uncharacterized protein n=1 Tax=Besnoitia besnoiti TaxID=94643 RepID=A0A2A9MPF3_BESBE|nr:hypothetical protein BESB_002740 [Besnoitia besnoiti]PFH37933.1 hypothetical protein BESB_002740 [Besnoitia besnoiti]